MYHRKQSIVSQDHSYLTISASSLTRFYFKLASNRLELSPIHPYIERKEIFSHCFSANLLSTISISFHASNSSFIDDFHQVAHVDSTIFSYIPYPSPTFTCSTWHTWLMQRTCTTYNALDLRVHVFTILCILWPAFYAGLYIQL